MQRYNLDIKDFDADTQRKFNVIKNTATGISVSIILIALTFTILTIILAVTVSPWFFIATIIVGGYTLLMIAVIAIQRILTRVFS